MSDSNLDQRIINVLRESPGPLDPRAIARQVGVSKKEVNSALYRRLSSQVTHVLGSNGMTKLYSLAAGSATAQDIPSASNDPPPAYDGVSTGVPTTQGTGTSNGTNDDRILRIQVRVPDDLSEVASNGSFRSSILSMFDFLQQESAPFEATPVVAIAFGGEEHEVVAPLDEDALDAFLNSVTLL